MPASARPNPEGCDGGVAAAPLPEALLRVLALPLELVGFLGRDEAEDLVAMGRL